MRFCLIGDSFVNGTGDDDCLGWVGRLVFSFGGYARLAALVAVWPAWRDWLARQGRAD